MTRISPFHRGLAAALCALGLWLGTAGLAGAADARPTPKVVEFYTAQGCPACLPALGMVAELAKRPDVLVLSLHVDYWDYMGWKDPFALPVNAQRQRLYTSQMAKPYVYTPQMVINGSTEVSATDRDAVWGAIDQAARPSRAPVSIESRGGQGLIVRIGEAAYDGQATVWLALYDSQRQTRVLRGANADNTITNANVVRVLTPIGSWTGKAIEIPLSTGGMAAERPDHCAILVQGEKLGPILGVAVMGAMSATSPPAR